MGPRTAKGAQTRLRIIRAAADLFHKQGVRATSPDEVIEASEVGKGQFYHYFKNKEDLVHQALQTHLEAIRAGAAPVPYDVSSWADLERWFVTQIELQKSFNMVRGCPFGTIANELTVQDELVRQDLRLIFEVVRNKLAKFFIAEKATARLAEDVDEEGLADFCIAAIQGAMLMGKLWRNSQPVETAVSEALAHLRGYVIAPGRPPKEQTRRRTPATGG